jgi:competence protein ComEA
VPPAALVNLNTATAAELDALQGVGPATAQKIIDYRTTNGPFKTIAELKNVPGIGDAKFTALKPYITVQ